MSYIKRKVSTSTFQIIYFRTIPRGWGGVIKCKKLKVFEGSRVVYQTKGLDEYFSENILFDHPEGVGGVIRCVKLKLSEGSRVIYQTKGLEEYFSENIFLDHSEGMGRGHEVRKIKIIRR